MEKEDNVILAVLALMVLVSFAGVALIFSEQDISGYLVKSYRPATAVANPGGATVASRRYGEAPQPLQFGRELKQQSEEGAESERLVGRYHKSSLR